MYIVQIQGSISKCQITPHLILHIFRIALEYDGNLKFYNGLSIYDKL